MSSFITAHRPASSLNILFASPASSTAGNIYRVTAFMPASALLLPPPTPHNHPGLRIIIHGESLPSGFSFNPLIEIPNKGKHTAHSLALLFIESLPHSKCRISSDRVALPQK